MDCAGLIDAYLTGMSEGMNFDAAMERRFQDYVEDLGAVVGNDARRRGLGDYLGGLLLPGERKSMEPIAERLESENVSRRHQSIQHFVSEASWRDGPVRERVLGRALKGRDDVVVATKFGNLFDEASRTATGRDASAESVREQCEASLRRLDRDVVDLYQFHIGDYDPVAAEDVVAFGLEPPAIVVIGEVVRLRAALDWLGALSGRQLVVDPLGTRGSDRAHSA